MAEYPYTPNPANLPKFLLKIQEVGIPERISVRYLASLGFKSSNDRYIPKVLQALGFVDNNNVPTERWRLYRSKNQAPQIMAQALREAYKDLFTIYPDACARDDDALEDFFATHTNVGDRTLDYIIRTFKALCNLADFPKSISTVVETVAAQAPQDVHRPPTSIGRGAMKKFEPSIHIDIQIHISPDASSEQIEEIFKHMAKYIFHYEG